MTDSESFGLRMPGVALVVEERESPSERYPNGLIILRTDDQSGTASEVNLTAMESIKLGMELLKRGVRLLGPT